MSAARSAISSPAISPSTSITTSLPSSRTSSTRSAVAKRTGSHCWSVSGNRSMRWCWRRPSRSIVPTRRVHGSWASIRNPASRSACAWAATARSRKSAPRMTRTSRNLRACVPARACTRSIWTMRWSCSCCRASSVSIMARKSASRSAVSARSPNAAARTPRWARMTIRTRSILKPRCPACANARRLSPTG